MGFKMLLLKNLANSSSLNTTWRETKGKWRCFFLTFFLLACFLCFFLPLFFGGSFSFWCKSHLGFPYTYSTQGERRGEKTIDNPATLKKNSRSDMVSIEHTQGFPTCTFFYSSRENYSCFFSKYCNKKRFLFLQQQKKRQFHKRNEKKSGEIKVQGKIRHRRPAERWNPKHTMGSTGLRIRRIFLFISFPFFFCAKAWDRPVRFGCLICVPHSSGGANRTSGRSRNIRGKILGLFPQKWNRVWEIGF